MPAHLNDDVRGAVLAEAEAEARAGRSATSEAEHLLLALAALDAEPVARALADHGLDRPTLRSHAERLLDRERPRPRHRAQARGPECR